MYKIHVTKLRPGKTGIFGKRSLRRKTVDVADFSNDIGGVDKTDAFDGSQCIRNSRSCFSIALSYSLTCSCKRRMVDIEMASI